MSQGLLVLVQPSREGHSMPRRSTLIAFGVATVVASIPARGQLVPEMNLNRPMWTPPPRHMDDRPRPPWSAAPAPGPGLSLGGMTQLQAMDRLAAAGFTNINPPDPTGDGGWAGYASLQGRKVRAKVDYEGKISTK